MADPHASTTPPLDADDPRISAWIDGRLPPHEAADVERAVAASPELTRLVEDLLAIRVAMRAPAGGGPEVDLRDRIMAALATSNGNGHPVAAASRMSGSKTGGGRSLPWLSLAGALAAGFLVAIVINLPNDAGRDVALAPDVEQAPSDVPAFDDLAAPSPSPSPPGEFLGGRSVGSDALHDEAAATFADVDHAALLQKAGAPASPPPAAAPLRAAESKVRAEGEQAAMPRSRQSAPRTKMDLAGVLVIAVTSPTERRALDRLVADSGLEVTPDKDHLELVGTSAKVNAFLTELTRVGLVSAVPARRAATAGKLKGSEKQAVDQSSLILRVVERKATQPAAAGEADTQP